MEKAFTVNLVSYIPILKNAGIRFKEDEKTLMVGKPTAKAGYVIIVSSRTVDTPILLTRILPILKDSKAAYRIIKDQHFQYRLNAGAFGDEEAGKALVIFPCNIDEAKRLVHQIVPQTQRSKGPVVMNAQQISNVVFIQKITADGNGDLLLEKPGMKQFPFIVDKAYREKKKFFGLIGRYYLPVQILRSNSKGAIFKAINLKRFAFNWCIIKEGKPVALDDHFDRDMKDRLVWQENVHRSLVGKVYTPDVIDFFSRKGYHYLVMNFAEGISYGEYVRNELSGKQWTELNSVKKAELLGYFIQAAELVENVHNAGFVHRDVTDGNFIVLDDGQLCIIDFELSYHVQNGEPNPPFLLGTFGYVAPEQINHAIPNFKEDIYSLGALLCFTLTGCKTWEYITPNLHHVRVKTMRLTNERELTELIIKCLSSSRTDRPNIGELLACVKGIYLQQKNKTDEKIPMAV